MARPREPIALVKAKGKKHLTKAEIAKRESEEVKVDLKNVQPPEYLTGKLVDEFNELAEKLLHIGIMTELDDEALARYLIAKQQYLQYTQLLTQTMNKPNKSWTEVEQVQNLQDKMFRQVRAAAGDLGLTISARCKLVVPTKNEPPKKNKFSQFGG